MDQKTRQEALALIEAEQRGTEHSLSGTASVVVSIGGTTEEGQVEHESLYLKQAPDHIIGELRDAGFEVHLSDDGAAEVYRAEGDSDD